MSVCTLVKKSAFFILVRHELIKQKEKKMQDFEKRRKMICELLESSLYVPMKEKELAVFLQVKKEERQDLKEVLSSLIKDGLITMTQNGKYMKEEAKIIGTFISNQRGFGFVEVEGQEEDFFISPEHINGAFHNDKVEVRLLGRPSGKRQEAEIVKIVERGTNQIVGTYDERKNFGFVIPDNQKFSQDIFVPKERSKGAVNGHKVVVEITDFGNERKNPEGKVIEILGHSNDPGVDILSIIKAYGIPTEFPEKVMNQVERVRDSLIKGDFDKRTDLRKVQMVTIDGEDAKDLDDAVSVVKLGDEYELGVHIADVSNYVQENSALDWDARDRGTSVYLADRVVPMLPHKLSNGICSLNQKEDRLALSCIMHIDQKGTIVDHKIVESVICVDRRMSYTAVAKILEDHDEETIKEYEELVPMFEMMKELSDLLREKRHKRGSVDFDFPESKIVIDANGFPIDIKSYDRNCATKIIEDFMLAANETVAQHFYWMEIPFVYRTHESPDMDKIRQLSTFIYNMGYSIHVTGDEVHPKEIQKLICKTEGTPEEALIARLTLRSMKQAKYTTECTGHFGLACDYYCHFTSPIRRYPDLIIHRIIKEALRGRMNESRIQHYQEILTEIAAHSSKMERRADEAERETDKLKKAQYMTKHIGEIFEGVISGVTAWGVYVELPNTVEGMVHVSKMTGDFYVYDEQAYELRGTSTKKSYKLGQKVQIVVDSVDFLTRTVNFGFIDGNE